MKNAITFIYGAIIVLAIIDAALSLRTSFWYCNARSQTKRPRGNK